MTDKRIETAVPSSSYELVREAAARMGLTIRGFAAMAIYNTAVSILTTEKKLIGNDDIHLSQDEWSKIREALRHPEWFEKRISQAQERSKQIPHRDVPEEERL